MRVLNKNKGCRKTALRVSDFPITNNRRSLRVLLFEVVKFKDDFTFQDEGRVSGVMESHLHCLSFTLGFLASFLVVGGVLCSSCQLQS